MTYTVAVGGTFDLFHKGHERMIEAAIKSGDAIVGITSDQLANKSRDREVNTYERRKKRVEDFCNTCSDKYGNNFIIRKINSPEGGVVYEDNIEEIIVSPEPKTIERVKRINTERDEKGLDPLTINVVGTIRSQDGEKISSTRIYKNEINREGDLLGNLAVINDIHYGFKEETNQDVLDKTVEVLDPFDNIIVNGDIIHDSGSKEEDLSNFKKVWDIIEDNVENAYFAPGNHDVINISIDEIENIVGHEIPKKIEVEGEKIILVDSCSQSNSENIGLVSEESLELINNLEQEAYIVSHFPLDYTDYYQESKFFGEYPETVFPINKYYVNFNEDYVKKKIYAHLHLDDKELENKNATIRSPILDITNIEPREGEAQNSVFVIK